MKKFFTVFTAIALILCIAFSLAACGKKASPAKADKFDDLVMQDAADESRTISFDNGVYTDNRNGRSYTGLYQYFNDTLRLSPYGQNYVYHYKVQYDEDGNISGMTNDQTTFVIAKK